MVGFQIFLVKFGYIKLQLTPIFPHFCHVNVCQIEYHCRTLQMSNFDFFTKKSSQQQTFEVF
jgi:hypothetical protein